MINTFDLGRIHFCIRKSSEGNISHHVIKVSGCEVKNLTCRNEMKNILFATQILFVKGINDKLLIELVLEKEESLNVSMI